MIHTPKKSEALLAQLNEACDIVFTDCSWGNDEADSVWNEETGIKIWFPNPKMEWFDFCVKVEDTEEYLSDYFDNATISDVATIVKQLTTIVLEYDNEQATLIDLVKNEIDVNKDDILPQFTLEIGQSFTTSYYTTVTRIK